MPPFSAVQRRAGPSTSICKAPYTVASQARSAPRPVVARATAELQASRECTQAVDLLKRACADPSVDKADVFQAMRTIQKEKLPADKWDEIVGCNKFWRLVYTASADAVQKDMKAKGESGQRLAGFFFPITAAQVFNLNNAPKGEISNGVYVPHVFALRFVGEYTMEKGSKKLQFQFSGLKLKLGPLKLGPFKVGGGSGDDGSKKGLFNFFYADEDLICAMGGGGGIAFWAKADEETVVRKGLEV